MKATHQATGHLDKKGKMISRHDLVLAIRFPSVWSSKAPGAPRPAHVLWVGRQWILRFEDKTTEPLNLYPQKAIEIVGQ